MKSARKWKKSGFSAIFWAVTAVLAFGTNTGLATEVCVDFEELGGLVNGDYVEGLGTVHPLLNISDAVIGGNLVLIEEGTPPQAYTGGESGINECLDPDNEPGHGFGNVAEENATENLKFTFDPSISVTSFSIRLIDYGDYFPFAWASETTHTVKLVAYDSEDLPRSVLSTDELTFTSTYDNQTGIRTMTTLNGVDIADVSLEAAGDACLADVGEPGQWTFSVSGDGIVCVELQFINDSFGFPVSTDGDVAFDDICFTYDGGAVNVDIDIKPGSYPNSINLGSNGVVPVAILSSDTFEASSVDPDTITLAGAGVAVRGKSNKSLAHDEDVNADGLMDLVCQVETENLDPGQLQDGYAVLTGNLLPEFGGTAIEGSDEITIVPPE